jgi:hypothetical protein
MADLGIKLTADEVADAFKDIKISPEEMNASPSSRYPGPKSVTDEQAGVSTSPIKSVRFPGTALSTPLRQDMSQLEFDAKAKGYADDASRVEEAIGDATLGKLLGSVKLGTQAVKSAKMGINAGSQFAKAGEEAGFFRNVLEHNAQRLFGEKAAFQAAAKLGASREQIARAMAATGKAALPAATTAGGAVGRDAAGIRTAPALGEPEPKVYRGAMSNAIERLRASAPGNPRAQALLDKIDQIPADNGAGTGTVTQGTIGSE